MADFAGRPLRLDEDLERRIGEIIARFARRWNLDPKALQIANRKQAMVPEGAVALDPVGTAPGLVVPAGGQVVVVLPGPAARAAGELEPGRRDRALQGRRSRRAPRYRQTMMRLFGIPESEIAETLRVAERRHGPRRARDHDLPAPRRARDRDPGRRDHRATAERWST